MTHVGKINVSLWGRRVGSLVAAPRRGVYAFRFERDFLASGIEISPLMMPLRREPPLVGEASLRIIDLHRGDTKVGKDEIEGSVLPRHFIDVPEVRPDRGEDVLSVSLIPKALARLHDFNRIHIKAA